MINRSSIAIAGINCPPARRSRVVLMFLLAIALVFTGRAWGQIDTATLVGTVADPSGAVIPNATVTVRDEGTGLTNSKLCASSA